MAYKKSSNREVWKLKEFLKTPIGRLLAPTRGWQNIRGSGWYVYKSIYGRYFLHNVETQGRITSEDFREEGKSEDYIDPQTSPQTIKDVLNIIQKRQEQFDKDALLDAKALDKNAAAPKEWWSQTKTFTYLKALFFLQADNSTPIKKGLAKDFENALISENKISKEEAKEIVNDVISKIKHYKTLKFSQNEFVAAINSSVRNLLSIEPLKNVIYGQQNGIEYSMIGVIKKATKVQWQRKRYLNMNMNNLIQEIKAGRIKNISLKDIIKSTYDKLPDYLDNEIENLDKPIELIPIEQKPKRKGRSKKLKRRWRKGIK